MKKLNQKGITLVSLVITIIVLLILAGITINLTIGERGIIAKAQQAGKNYINAQEREEVELANFENEMENIINGASNNNNVESAIKIVNIDSVEVPGRTAFNKSYDISSLTNKYKELTVDNFVLDLLFIHDVHSYDFFDVNTGGVNVQKTYDAENGILNIVIPPHSRAGVSGRIKFNVLGIF